MKNQELGVALRLSIYYHVGRAFNIQSAKLFTALLSVGMEQTYPKKVSLVISCTLYKLALTTWRSNLPYTATQLYVGNQITNCRQFIQRVYS